LESQANYRVQRKGFKLRNEKIGTPINNSFRKEGKYIKKEGGGQKGSNFHCEGKLSRLTKQKVSHKVSKGD